MNGKTLCTTSTMMIEQAMSVCLVTIVLMNTEDYADTMSLAVFLISLAVSVYFAELIRAVIPINLLLLLILVHIVYVLIRWYVKGCMRSRGYY